MGNVSSIEMIALLAKTVSQSAQQVSGILYGVPECKEIAKHENFVEYGVHCFMQTSGNTSCGWGGVGGQAFTNYWCAVVVYPVAVVSAIYVGRIAYICEVNDEFKNCLINGNMPEWVHLERSKLKILWKATR